MSTNVITAATVGSIICGLLLVAALSCTCKLYQLRVVDRHPPTHISPLREIEDELMRREAPPSYTATVASPHFDQAQRAFIEGIQAAVIARQDATTSGPERPRSSSRNNLMRLLSREGLAETAGVPAASESEVERRNSSGTEDVPACNENSNANTNTNSNETQGSVSVPVPAPAQTDDERGNADGESTTESMQNTTVGDNSNDIPMPTLSTDATATPTVAVNPVEAVSPSNNDGPPSESNSCCTSDTDSDTNQEAFEIEQREHNIIRAAANIRRMRIAGGLQNVIEGAQQQRSGGASPPPADDEPNENTNNSSARMSEAETLSDDAPLDLEESPNSSNSEAESTNRLTEASTSQSNDDNDDLPLLAVGQRSSDDDVPLILTQSKTNNSEESEA